MTGAPSHFVHGHGLRCCFVFVCFLSVGASECVTCCGAPSAMLNERVTYRFFVVVAGSSAVGFLCEVVGSRFQGRSVPYGMHTRTRNVVSLRASLHKTLLCCLLVREIEENFDFFFGQRTARVTYSIV